MSKKNRIYLLVWFIASMAFFYYLGKPLLDQKDQQMFLPGETSHGHHQIEMQCSTCHASPFGGGEVLQEACISCHGEELKMVSDSHPKSKFTDPRNADRIKKLDARFCVSCHREHKPDITGAMGVTLPDDFCFSCHENIAEERPSHKGMAFDTCASAGCHNYHDNMALYEDFLAQNAGGDSLLDMPAVPKLNAFHLYHAQNASLGLHHAAMSQYEEIKNNNEILYQKVPEHARQAEVLSQWQQSVHSQLEVDCLACHKSNKADSDVLIQENVVTPKWMDRPAAEICMDCHVFQKDTFFMGKHGMRIQAGLSPMMPEHAKIPMQDSAKHQALECTSCHGPHDTDLSFAAVDACLGCHNSEHALNYKQSPHGALFNKAIEDALVSIDTVTCATCHMPRETHKELIDGVEHEVVRVNHNQNHNLRPNEKMIRSVCMNCHSLAFSIDSLADEALIKNNFNGLPQKHIPSIDMALEREE